MNKLRFFIQEKKRHISGKVRTYYSSMTPDAKVNLPPTFSTYLLIVYCLRYYEIMQTKNAQAQVMRDLESGKVLCIICSNALEAGVPNSATNQPSSPPTY